MSLKCQKCGKVLNDTEFYTYKNGQKTEFCKKCLTMHIDNFDESTYLWLLEKMDVPYIPSEWVTLRDKAYAKEGGKINGMSVFGKYISKMKLTQYRNKDTGEQYGWADTEKLNKMLEEKAANQQAASAAELEKFNKDIQARFEAGEISEAEYKTLTSAKLQREAELSGQVALTPSAAIGKSNFFDESKLIPEKDLPDLGSTLTQEDKIFLAMKWGRMYQPGEWVELEKMYTDMEKSFDIQDADTKNTLVLLCKTTLKANQALDCGDVEGFQKLAKVQESLRKSAKFTAAQNKAEKEDCIDCIGELVALCEKDGFIPRYATDIPQDKVDITLKDMKDYVNKLITKDLGFGKQIEETLKRVQNQKDAEALKENENETISDKDYEAYFKDVEDQKQQELELIGLDQEEREDGIS